MSLPSAVDVYDAVRLNSVELLEAYLFRGADINTDISSALPLLKEVVTKDDNGHNVATATMEAVSLVARKRSSSSAAVTKIEPLHLAVFYCLYDGCVAAENDASPFNMVQFLLRHGANPSHRCENMYLIWMNDAISRTLHVSRLEGSSSAMVLSRSLPPFEQTIEQKETMVRVFLMLNSLEHLPKKPFPTSKLLLSSKLSDVMFLCSDGIELPSHKCILASASDYFDVYFDGPWGQHHPDGKWKTKHASDVMKTMLTFIYTGRFSFSADTDATFSQRLMKLAHECNLPKLFRLAEARCSLCVSLENLPAMMTEAQFYDAKILKRECAKFMTEHLREVVVMHPHLTGTLASDYPELWSELSDQLEPETKRHRRS